MNYYTIFSQHVCKTPLRGREVLEHSILNKGSAFSHEERAELRLHGLIPAAVETLEQQEARIYQAYQKKTEDLSRHIFLRELQDRNETLFYRLLTNHIQEMLPILYTPTVGVACQRFSEIYRRARGLFISFPEQERMEEMVANIALPDVKVIVVSDGERILGLGDQGIGGMGIPIGKTTLYTACGGIFPGVCLPVILDTGTDNEERLKDPFYFGWRHRRVRGKEYEDFVDRFVKAIIKRYPNVLLQWEDFAKENAGRLLEKYRDFCCTFNDDIQGTAAVALAGILAGVRANREKFQEQRFVIYGAGSAGTGIAAEIAGEMGRSGLAAQATCERIWMLDRRGLLHQGVGSLMDAQKPYAKSLKALQSLGMDGNRPILLEEVIEKVKPTVLIGVSGSAGAFTEKVVRTMAQFCHRPILFPLSNPSSHCEAHPSDLIQWTEGRARIATGTQFPDVPYRGNVYKIGQCNNYYIFPAMGLAIVAARIRRVTDGMFLASSEALSAFAPALQEEGAPLFPPPERVREISQKLAFLIAKQAMEEKQADVMTDEELHRAIQTVFWEPAYFSLRG